MLSLCLQGVKRDVPHRHGVVAKKKKKVMLMFEFIGEFQLRSPSQELMEYVQIKAQGDAMEIL